MHCGLRPQPYRFPGPGRLHGFAHDPDVSGDFDDDSAVPNHRIPRVVGPIIRPDSCLFDNDPLLRLDDEGYFDLYPSEWKKARSWMGPPPSDLLEDHPTFESSGCGCDRAVQLHDRLE